MARGFTPASANMRKIVNGKLYDTEKAEKVAWAESECGRRDFRWYDEKLYRTRNGRWFLAGEGGPLSRYRRPAPDGGWIEGDGIIPLTDDEARTWLEEHGETETILKFFKVEDA